MPEKFLIGDLPFLSYRKGLEVAVENVGKLQTWTMQGGLKVVGRVVDYVRRDLTVQRRRGKIYANGRSDAPIVFSQVAVSRSTVLPTSGSLPSASGSRSADQATS